MCTASDRPCFHANWRERESSHGDPGRQADCVLLYTTYTSHYIPESKATHPLLWNRFSPPLPLLVSLILSTHCWLVLCQPNSRITSLSSRRRLSVALYPTLGKKRRREEEVSLFLHIATGVPVVNSDSRDLLPQDGSRLRDRRRPQRHVRPIPHQEDTEGEP